MNARNRPKDSTIYVFIHYSANVLHYVDDTDRVRGVIHHQFVSCHGDGYAIGCVNEDKLFERPSFGAIIPERKGWSISFSAECVVMPAKWTKREMRYWAEQYPDVVVPMGETKTIPR